MLADVADWYGRLGLSPRFAGEVRSVRGARATADELESLLAAIAVHPEIAARARSLMRRQVRTARLSDHRNALNRADAAERLAYYLMAGLAHWDSHEARRRLAAGLDASERPYGEARIDPVAGAVVLPVPDWDLVRRAVAEAEECFATNLNDGVNPGKETMRTAGIRRPLFESDIYAYGRHPAVLRIVAGYLGMYPILRRINLLLSSNDRLQDNSSQFPHLDPEDFRQVKLFLHVSDVDEDSGPFQVLRGDASDAVQLRHGYRYGRLTDDDLFAAADRSALLVSLGPPGTAILADTARGFHFGSRPGSRPRRLVMYHYVTPMAAAWPLGASDISSKHSAYAKAWMQKTGRALGPGEDYLLGLRR